ncbi:hypothetical protein IAR50_002829 [Cryptococcus sp. DSM 104548]
MGELETDRPPGSRILQHPISSQQQSQAPQSPAFRVAGLVDHHQDPFDCPSPQFTLPKTPAEEQQGTRKRLSTGSAGEGSAKHSKKEKIGGEDVGSGKWRWRTSAEDYYARGEKPE